MKILGISNDPKLKEVLAPLFNEIGIEFSVIESEEIITKWLRNRSLYPFVNFVILGPYIDCEDQVQPSARWYYRLKSESFPVMVVSFSDDIGIFSSFEVDIFDCELGFLEKLAEFVRKEIPEKRTVYFYLSSIQYLLRKRNKTSTLGVGSDLEIRRLMGKNRRGLYGLRSLNTHLKYSINW